MFSSRRTHDLEHLVDTAGHSRERKERSITSPLLSAWPRSPLLAPSTWLQPSYRIAKFALTLPFIILLILWVTYPLSNSRSPGIGDAAPTTVEVPVYNQTAADLLAELQAAVAEKAAEQAAEQAAREAADQERFITEFLATDIAGVYDGQSLYDVCSDENIKWNPDIIFECPPNAGGFGNVRQQMLQCVRITIAAGGSMIMPVIAQRNQGDISDFRTRNFVPFEYFFNKDHFRSALASYCPHLKIYESLEELTDQPGIKDPMWLSPEDLPGLSKIGRIVTSNATVFHTGFHRWFKKQNKDKLSPRRVSLTDRIIWTWATSIDTPSFIRSFGSLIPVRTSIRTAAAKALYNMKTQYGLPKSYYPKDGIPADTRFVGIHLRAEKDSQEYHFTGFDLQSDYFADRIDEMSDVPAVYVASGDREMIGQFAELIAPVRVVTKADLLSAEDLAHLTWDQQALIDYLILERAAYVMGVRESSFAWTLALRRAAALNWVVGGFPHGLCWVTGEDGNRVRRGCEDDMQKTSDWKEAWHDDLTTLIGGLEGSRVESEDTLRVTIWP